MIQLLIPMSGKGKRFKEAGFNEPKPLIKIGSKTIIERLLESYPADWPTTFILAESHKNSALPDVLPQIRPGSKILYTKDHNKGPGWACLDIIGHLNSDAPVLVSYCDFGMSWDARQFERFVKSTNCDACLVSYTGFHAHYLNPQTYAYSLVQGGYVKEVKEKASFTSCRQKEYASAGAYYFSSTKLLEDSLNDQIEQGLTLNNEMYLSLTIQALLKEKHDAKVRVFNIPYFFQWGTPRDLKDATYWEKSFENKNLFDCINNECTVEQILLPMAGFGSRFKGLFNEPKPFIPLAGKPMFRNALDSFPKAKKTVLVSLKEHQPWLNSAIKKAESSVYLSSTPEGQALSTEAGLASLTPNKEVIVTACDHGIICNPNKWLSFKKRLDIDAAIFTISDLPAANRTPDSYAYVETSYNEVEFPKVKNVSVKRPLSHNPRNDKVLIGSFWFKNRDILELGISKLVAQDLRINDELYLDSIFPLLLQEGYNIVEFPLDGYIGWGDPQCFAESVYWQGAHCGNQHSLNGLIIPEG